MSLRAVEDEGYVQGRRDILAEHGLGCWAISNHLNGQAVCESILDDRHKGIVHPRVWGDGDPEGVRQRAAEEMKTTARAAAAFGVEVVVGFTGSAIWHYLAMFPPVSDEVIAAGYADFADRWNPIIDVFDEVGVRFAHEVHPSEIAYDYWSTVATLDAIGHREGFGLNYDPSHMVWQGLDYVGFLTDFADRIYHVDCKDTKIRMHNGRNGRLSSHLPWADPAGAGTSSPPATATPAGRTSSAASTTSATPARSPSSGRTPGWTGWPALLRLWSSSAASTRSPHRRPPSTPPSPPRSRPRAPPSAGCGGLVVRSYPHDLPTVSGCPTSSPPGGLHQGPAVLPAVAPHALFPPSSQPVTEGER